MQCRIILFQACSESLSSQCIVIGDSSVCWQHPDSATTAAGPVNDSASLTPALRVFKRICSCQELD